MNTSSNNQKRSRATLILLVLVFVLPILVAFLFHKNKTWLPASKNHGTLVNPVIELPEITLRTQKGERFELKDFRGKWSMIYLGRKECDEQCQVTLVKTRNARTAQGAEGNRVNIYIVFEDKAAEWTKTDLFRKNMAAFQVLTTDSRNIDVIRRTLGVSADSPDQVYLIDPAGNYLMYYKAGFDSLGIMEDLKLLLKASQIG